MTSPLDKGSNGAGTPQLIPLSDEWDSIDPSYWTEICFPPGKSIQDRLLRWKLESEIMRLLPQPGEWMFPPMPVFLYKGEQVKPHSHPQHLVIYYALVGDNAPAIIVEGERIQPVQNTVLYLPPNTQHAVEKSRSSYLRLSIAFRWSTT